MIDKKMVFACIHNDVIYSYEQIHRKREKKAETKCRKKCDYLGKLCEEYTGILATAESENMLKCFNKTTKYRTTNTAKRIKESMNTICSTYLNMSEGWVIITR